MEEKIYKKAVNKTNLGNRIIDSKSFLRQFSKKEVENLSENNDWAQCDNCEKWRMLPPWSDATELPDKVSPGFRFRLSDSLYVHGLI
jgi:hypothetical protein